MAIKEYLTGDVLKHTTDLINQANSGNELAKAQLTALNQRVKQAELRETRRDWRRFTLIVSGLIFGLVVGLLTYIAVSVQNGTFDVQSQGTQLFLAALGVSVSLFVGLTFGISYRAGLDLKRAFSDAKEASKKLTHDELIAELTASLKK